MTSSDEKRPGSGLPLLLYGVSLLLPVTFTRYGVTSWGWQVALASIVIPPAALSNLGFFAAAAMKRAAPGAALAAAGIAIASMLYCGFAAPDQPGDLVGIGGHLGPGYYLWLLAGAFMLRATWYAQRSQVELPTGDVPPTAQLRGRFHDQAATINAQIAAAAQAKKQPHAETGGANATEEN